MKHIRVISENPVLSFADATLRGCGQVWFQNNPLTGILLFAGIFYNSATLGACAVLGTLSSTAAAYLLGADRNAVRDGLYGFNGTLTGVALGFYFVMDPLHYLYLIFAAAVSSVFMAALANFLGKWGVAALTAPFVLTTWLAIFCCYQFSQLHPNELIGPVALVPNGLRETGVVTWNTWWEGITKGVGEVMFQDNVVTGLIFLLALLVNSRAACAWAALASALGLATAYGLGCAEGPLRLGLYGYSAVLTGIALGSGVFFPMNWRNSIYALSAVVLTSVAQGAVTVMLAPLGMPPLTWPFILVTWVFLLAVPNCRCVGGAEA